MTQEVLSEERGIREIESARHLLHGQLRGREQCLGIDYHRVRDPRRCAVIRHLSCYDGQILGRDAEFVGVILHLARDGDIGGQQREELAEDDLLTRAGLTLHGQIVGIYSCQLEAEQGQQLGIYLVVVGVAGALVALVHQTADLQNVVELLLCEHYAGILAHQHMYGRGPGEVYVAQKFGVDAQRVALEVLSVLELLNDRSGEGDAHRAGRELVLVFVDGNITFTLQTDEDASAVEYARDIVLVDNRAVILAVDVCEQRSFVLHLLAVVGVLLSEVVHRMSYFDYKYTNFL